MFKHPRFSKTAWFGLLVMVLSVLELAQNYLPALLVDVTPKMNAWISLGIGAMILILRFVTNAPLSFKAKDYVP